jgi:hypothetical protein
VLARARAAERERDVDKRVADGARGGALGCVGEHERMQDADAAPAGGLLIPAPTAPETMAATPFAIQGLLRA